MSKISYFQDHALLRDQARELNLTYLEYRDLIEVKGVPLDVAIENARRGITLENYLKTAATGDLLESQATAIDTLVQERDQAQAYAEAQDGRVESLTAERNRYKWRARQLSMWAAGAAIIFAIFRIGPLLPERDHYVEFPGDVAERAYLEAWGRKLTKQELPENGFPGKEWKNGPEFPGPEEESDDSSFNNTPENQVVYYAMLARQNRN